jgi:hypothetical protein
MLDDQILIGVDEDCDGEGSPIPQPRQSCTQCAVGV